MANVVCDNCKEASEKVICIKCYEKDMTAKGTELALVKIELTNATNQLKKAAEFIKAFDQLAKAKDTLTK